MTEYQNCKGAIHKKSSLGLKASILDKLGIRLKNLLLFNWQLKTLIQYY